MESLHCQGMGEDLEIIVQDGDVELDKGQSDALNKGFAKAKGEWFFWLNADDVLLSGALKKVRAVSDAHSWIAGNQVTMDEEGRVIRCLRDRGEKAVYEGRPVRVYGPSSFFRRELFERVGGFNTSLRYAMDTDLWTRFRAAGHWYRKIDDYLFAFRIHRGSLTSNPQKPQGEQARQDMEVERVHRMNGVRMTAKDVRAVKFRRLLDGSYLHAVWDTLRYRGRKAADLDL